MDSFRSLNGLKRKILIVDDELINREILANILEGYYDVSFAGNGREALDTLLSSKVPFSLVLLDLLMPEMDGFEFLDNISRDEKLSGIPVIVMTSEKPAEVESIKHGAADFITKPYDMPEVIIARCRRIIELYEDKTIIRAAERDELTGLYSKEFFYEYIRQLDDFEDDKEMDAIVLNIEHFHIINEMYGREVGDEILSLVGSKLSDILGSRPDADTFYFYVEHSEEYMKRFTDLQDEMLKHASVPHLRLRMGVYRDVDKTESIESRFDHAKLACDKIRGDYTKQIEVYSKEQNEADLYHEKLINDIDAAIENKDFVVFFQPKYGVLGREPMLRSAEALIRWKHKELGMISPGDFIPLFESNGLVQKLDYFVWSEAAATIKRWRDKYGISVPVSVNVSRVDIYDPELEDKLMDILARNGLTPADMMLEVTESAYSEDDDALVETVERLQARGFKIEMDDFGTGYSALNTITTLPFDVLKLDMKFVRNMNKDAKSMKLVEFIMGIASFLDVPVVAEGVEDETQLAKLRSIGCDVIQGFYFSKPVPSDEFEVFIEKEIERRKHSIFGKKLLLVEDSEINREIAYTMLCHEGCTVETADNGQVALDAIGAASVPFDAILMDIQMPVMGGYEAAKEIRKTDADTPIVAITASDSDEDKEEAAAAGMNAHVAKPFNTDVLIDTLLEVLHID